MMQMRGLQSMMPPREETDRQQGKRRKKPTLLHWAMGIILVMNLIFSVNALFPIIDSAVVRFLTSTFGLLSIIFIYVAWRFLRSSGGSAGTNSVSQSQPQQVRKPELFSPVKQEALPKLPNTALASLGKSPADTVKQEALLNLPEPVFRCNLPLNDSAEFFGRTGEYTELRTRTSWRGSTSIIGPSRIGKTWLIKYFVMRLAEDEPDYTFRIGYLDITLPSCSTVAGFTAVALEALDCTGYDANQSKTGLGLLENAVKDLNSKNVIPILCLDEFDGLQNKKGFNERFFAGLRAITQIGLVLIVASKQELIRVVNTEVNTSPFFNIFKRIELGPFTREEVDEFVANKGDKAGFTKLERMHLRELGQQLPLRLQMAGQSIVYDKSLADEKGSSYYRPYDQVYWEELEQRFEEQYRAVAFEETD